MDAGGVGDRSAGGTRPNFGSRLSSAWTAADSFENPDPSPDRALFGIASRFLPLRNPWSGSGSRYRSALSHDLDAVMEYPAEIIRPRQGVAVFAADCGGSR